MTMVCADSARSNDLEADFNDNEKRLKSMGRQAIDEEKFKRKLPAKAWTQRSALCLLISCRS
jgi:hypothetical protein